MKTKNKYKFQNFKFSLLIVIPIIFICFICITDNSLYYLNIKNNIIFFFTKTYSFKPGESPIEKKILSLLDSAKKEIYLFSFDLDSSNIIRKLIELNEKGININIIVDPDNTPKKVIAILAHFKFLHYYNPPKLMHHKILLVDNKIVALGSMNFTINGIYFNNNDFIVIFDRSINNFFKNYFFLLSGKSNKCKHYVKTSINNINISIYLTRFNDIDVNSIIKKYISNARKKIFFAYSTFTNTEIAKLIIQKVKNNNLAFTGILEKRNSYSKYSVYNYFDANRLKIFRDENESIMHLKVIVIDNFTITGSYAIANRSNKKGYLNKYNDDLIIIFESEDISKFYINYIKSLIY